MNLQENTNPFVGLRPFEKDESLLFFGRQEQTLELLQRLHRHHFVAIVGSSGSGKSSLIRAGLIPSLLGGYLVDDRDRWLITIMKPGQNPLYNLAEAILNQPGAGTDASSVTGLLQRMKEEGADAVLDTIKHLWLEKNTNLFLLVDQFEELFRFSMQQKEVEKKDDATDFVNILLKLSEKTDLPIYVVITMRSDFIGDCAQFNGLPEAMNQSQYLVPRVNRVQLKNAIEGPVKLYGGNINPALTSKLLNEVATVKDELPLLQHALMRIWDHEKNVDKTGELDLKDYESIGGLEKALSNHADEALNGMTDAELNLTKKIFQALTAIDENGRKIRRPVHLKELQEITNAGREQLLKIINRFIEDKRSFLLLNKTSDEDDFLIDISHESLIRRWNTLNDWVDDEAESAKIYLRLAESADLYKLEKKDFITGSELAMTWKWYKKFNPSVIWSHRYNEGFEEIIKYLEGSEQQRKVEENTRKVRSRNQRILIFGSIAVVIIVFSLVFYTVKERQSKSELTEVKEAFRLNALAQEWKSKDPTIAMRIEEIAMQKYPDSMIARAAQRIYEDNAFYKIISKYEGSSFKSFALSHDGTKILTGSNYVATLSGIDGTVLKEFRINRDGPENWITSVAFSPDGTKILTASEDDTVRVWSIDSILLHKFKVGTGEPSVVGRLMSVAFSPDGAEVLTGSEFAARLWKMNGTLLKEIRYVGDGFMFANIWSVRFSPDGTSIITTSGQGLKLWSKAGKLLNEYTANTDDFSSAAFSSDGKKIIAGCWDGSVNLYMTREGVKKKFIIYSTEEIGFTGGIKFVAFSPDGTKILTGSTFGVRLISVEGTLLKEFQTFTKGLRDVVSLGFSPDGTRAFIGYTDATTVWNIENTPSNEFYVSFGMYWVCSSDGTKILAHSTDTARLYDMDGKMIKEFKTSKDDIIAFSPDGTIVFNSLSDGNLQIWSIKDGLIKDLNEPSYTVKFSPDGRKILTGSEEGKLSVWTIKGELLKEFKGKTDSSTSISYPDGILSIAISKDETKILASHRNGLVRLWNMDGRLLEEFSEMGEIEDVAFSPDGTKILTGSRYGIISLWGIDGKLLKQFGTGKISRYHSPFSPDGSKILVLGVDAAALWNIDGNVIMNFRRPFSRKIEFAGFSPDGKKIHIAYSDGAVIQWNSNAMSLEKFLQSGLIEPLTTEQKQEFGITADENTINR